MSHRDHWDIVVVGGGAAGLMAAACAADGDRTNNISSNHRPRVLLLEKNRKLGVKILMSGGTRCNLTHHTDTAGIVSAFGKSGRFLHSALAALDPTKLVELFNRLGVETKVESTGKVFPVSDRALEVRDALAQRLLQSGCTVRTQCAVSTIGHDDNGFLLRLHSPADNHFDEPLSAESLSAESLSADRIIIACGGKSYPGCGTTGDGYAWAQHFGHTIVPPVAALAPLMLDEPWPKSLAGITVEKAKVQIVDRAIRSNKKAVLSESLSSLLFTHRGLSGPAAMNVSAAVERNQDKELLVRIDFAPGENVEQAWESLWESLQTEKQSHLTALPFVRQWSQHRMPRRLLETLLQNSGIKPIASIAEVGKSAWRRFVEGLKRTELPVSQTEGFRKAEVTSGGVTLNEVDSSTMQSKKQAGLYFAGEILDLDGPIGGFNFQAAFSTGWLAGHHAAESLT